MNPRPIERPARERPRRADVDGCLHVAGHRIVRLPLRGVPSIGALRRRRRHDPCAPVSRYA